MAEEPWLDGSVENKPPSQPAEGRKIDKVMKKPEIEGAMFSDKEIEDWLSEPVTTSSKVCWAMYGEDGTAKTGTAMDCRTPEEVKAGKKIIFFDLDNSGAPIWEKYHNMDKNIILKDPTTYKEDVAKTEIDYYKTMEKLRASFSYLLRKQDQFKDVKAVILDGVDKLLKMAEWQMRVDNHLERDGGVQYRYWNKRNLDYFEVMEMMKRLPWDRYYITHMKYDKLGQTKVPSWQGKTADMMFQKTHHYVEDIGSTKTFKAKIMKFKTDITLEGQEIVVAEVDKDTKQYKWNGLWEVFK